MTDPLGTDERWQARQEGVLAGLVLAQERLKQLGQYSGAAVVNDLIEFLRPTTPEEAA